MTFPSHHLPTHLRIDWESHRRKDLDTHHHDWLGMFYTSSRLDQK